LENDGEVIIEDPDNGEKTSILPTLIPWYRGFKGTIKQDGVNRFITEGIVTKGVKNTKNVSELPISMWTNKFKEFCEDLLEDKKIKDMKNYSTTKDVNFVLSELGDGILCNIDNLKLTSYIYTSNMVLFNEKNQLKKYDNVDEIVDNFCKVRYDFYVKRKKYQIKNLENEIRHLGNKERFIQEVIDKKLTIMNVPEEQVLDELKKRKYDEEPKTGGYDYLLRLQVRTFTADKIKQLKNDIESSQTKLDILRATSESKLWLNELGEFEKKYMSWLKDMEGRVSKKAKSKK
jgi:DNA topoisomerase-2